MKQLLLITCVIRIIAGKSGPGNVTDDNGEDTLDDNSATTLINDAIIDDVNNPNKLNDEKTTNTVTKTILTSLNLERTEKSTKPLQQLTTESSLKNEKLNKSHETIANNQVNSTTDYSNSNWTSRLHPHHSKWQEYGPFFTFTLFIVITGLTKVGFHHAKFLISRLPEACLLIVSGAIVGAIMHTMGAVNQSIGLDDNETHPVLTWPLLPPFTPTLFFGILLPPVILESAYSLYDRQFANNLTTVLLFAVVGTLYNAFSFGLLLYALIKAGCVGSLSNVISEGFNLGIIDCLLFGSIGAAVDPVAVLAIFQQLGVNKDLYFLLFGESLLNDAVTVALYSNVVKFSHGETIQGVDYGVAIITLFAASLGGAVLGIIGGLLSALVTRVTRRSRVVEPLAVLGIAYLSYLTAELFHLSAIISIITCGLLQAHYALKNISSKSYTTVKYFTKMISCTSDSAIFLFLGAALVGELHAWHFAFIAWSLILCLLVRFIGIFVLTGMRNAVSERRVGLKHQLVLSYGGLRGATCFALARMLDDAYPPSELFATTALAIVLFTVFIQGTTIKFLIEGLKIEKNASVRKTLNEEIIQHVSAMVITGVEEIARARGDHYIQRKLQSLDQRYFKKIFLNAEAGNEIKKLFEQISLTDHFDKLYTHDNRFSSRQFVSTPEPGSRNEALFLRTFGLLRPRLRQSTALDKLHLPDWMYHPKSAGPEALNEAMTDSPFMQFQNRHDRHEVADRPKDLREIIRMRRGSILRLGRQSEAKQESCSASQFKSNTAEPVASISVIKTEDAEIQVTKPSK